MTKEKPLIDLPSYEDYSLLCDTVAQKIAVAAEINSLIARTLANIVTRRLPGPASISEHLLTGLLKLSDTYPQAGVLDTEARDAIRHFFRGIGFRRIDL